ncbi:MAG TPA: AI-2E family transporter [Candidatus Limnocylindrales bacterium]|nr:AI-2E family transporter [Candidatus Limnocylindrales bacterium]
MTTQPRPAQPAPPVPDWLANLAALGWRVVAIALLGVVAWLILSLLWTVTASIAVAIVVSAVAVPLVRRLSREGRSRTAAAGIVWVGAIVVVVGLVVLLALAFLPYLADIVARVEEARAAIAAELDALGVPPAVGAALAAIFEAVRRASAGEGGGLGATIVEVGTVVLLASFLVFFFVRDGDRAWAWAMQGLDEGKRGRITAAGSDALVRVGGYLRGTAVLSGIIAATDLVFMAILGVPLAVPLAVLVFFAGFVPYFGGVITTILIAIVTWVSVGPASVAILLVLIGIRNVVLGYGVRPALYGRTTNIHPAIVLVALPAGYAAAGVVGLFVAVPFTAIVLAVAGAVVRILDPEEPPALPALIPPWFDRIAQWSWRLLLGCTLVALVVAVCVTIPTVVIPLILAFVFAASLDPVVLAVMRRGHSRARATAMVVAGGTLGIAAVIALAVVSLAGAVVEIAQTALDGAQVTSGALGGHLGPLVQALAGVGGTVAASLAELVDAAATVGLITVLSILLAFYLLRDGRPLWHRFVQRAAPPMRGELHGAGKRAFDVLGGYMTGTAVISFVGSASQFAIMVLLGIELALPVFVLSFFLCFIPYIGGFISTGIALMLTIATGDPLAIAVMVLWTLVFNIVTGNIVSPIVYGRTVHLHPAIVLVAIPAGGAIAGILGMFFVVPLIGVVAVTWRSVLRLIGAHSDRTRAGLPEPDATGQVDPSSVLVPGVPVNPGAAGVVDAPAGPA